MSRMKYKNLFGAQASSGGLDVQRTDLWQVNITLPDVIGIKWEDEVQFALEKFPFPTRERNMIPIKYMQQTNFLIGHDAESSAVEIPVRYAFSARTIEALEKWYYLVSNPETGGVGLTSRCKTNGEMRWMIPNQSAQEVSIATNSQISQESTMIPGRRYKLEGCLIKGLKLADADMTQSGYVNANFSLQVDRWYPVKLAEY